MRIIIHGASGFIGSDLKRLLSKDHIVKGVVRHSQNDSDLEADLMNLRSVESVYKIFKPEIIINCAGIIANDDTAFQNQTFSKNIILASKVLDELPKKIIITGSAAEYGEVPAVEIPVKEETLLRAQQAYGLAKKQETMTALELGRNLGVPTIIARVFNPIGSNMNKKFLLPQLIRQVKLLINGQSTSIEISRLDSTRDYLAVRDVSLAYKTLIEDIANQEVYNIGSGRGTSNGELLDLIVSISKLNSKPQIIETSKSPESTVANCADITRIRNELGWKPTITLKQVVEDVWNAQVD